MSTAGRYAMPIQAVKLALKFHRASLNPWTKAPQMGLQFQFVLDTWPSRVYAMPVEPMAGIVLYQGGTHSPQNPPGQAAPQTAEFQSNHVVRLHGACRHRRKYSGSPAD